MRTHRLRPLGDVATLRRRGLLLVLVALLGARAASAADDAKGTDELDRWVPSLGLTSGLLVEWAEASIKSRSSFSLFQTTDGTGIRNDKNGDDFMITPYFGGGLELMTPGERSLPGAPRLFVHAGAAATFAFDRDIAKEGKPGDPMKITTNAGGASEFSVLNQGSKVNIEVQGPLINAGAGVAFSFDVEERRVRVKTSIEYLQEHVEMQGDLARAANFNRNNPGLPAAWVLLQLAGNKEQTYHMLGPGLEIEFDAARADEFLISLYLEGNAYYTLNERGISLSQVPLFGTTPIGDVNWHYRKDPWTFLTGVGIRFRWSPE